MTTGRSFAASCIMFCGLRLQVAGRRLLDVLHAVVPGRACAPCSCRRKSSRYPTFWHRSLKSSE